MTRTIDVDAVVIGGGLAGLYAVLHMPEDWSIVVVDKGATRQSGSSPLAQGGMAVAAGQGDSANLHAADTIRAGAGANVRPSVEVLVSEAPAELARLVELGCLFDRRGDGDLDLHREAGQSVARSVHWADATGKEIMRVVVEAARKRAERILGTATAVLVENGACAGVRVAGSEGDVEILAPATLLATGGCGALYPSTTNVPAATGDGIAIAYAAGAAVTGLEFVQFHPTALATGGLQRVLLTEALRGSGAVIVDEHGKRFLFDHHPDGELAPRDVVARAISARGGAMLDATDVRDVRERFPNVAAAVGEAGFDLAAAPIPVEPAAHYLLGGVATDTNGRTSLGRLYAAGECAWTGVHGANRMAGNSLAEAVVFGRRAAQTIVGDAGNRRGATAPPPGASVAGHPPVPATPVRASAADGKAQWDQLRRAMKDGAGLVRTAASLREAAAVIEEIAAAPASEELRLAIVTASLVCRSALLRAESRGTHYRADFPDPSPDWDGAVVSFRHA